MKAAITRSLSSVAFGTNQMATAQRRTAESRGVLRYVLSLAAFVVVFAGHALYIRYWASKAIPGWASEGIGDVGLWSFGSYIAAQDYFLGFSYALGTAFAVWAGLRFLHARQAAHAAGTAGSITLVGGLMASGCFLIGCCGSPMLAVYVAIFGAKAVGVGKPLMAGITALAVGCGYWCLSRATRGGDNCCGD